MSLVDNEKFVRGDEKIKSRSVYYETCRKTQSNTPKIQGKCEKRRLLGKECGHKGREESKRQV